MVANRAESDDDKRQIVDRILDVWLRNPELRLGQLLTNTGGIYYTEDFTLAKRVEDFYRNYAQ